jgi:hypothetical protein
VCTQTIVQRLSAAALSLDAGFNFGRNLAFIPLASSQGHDGLNVAVAVQSRDPRRRAEEQEDARRRAAEWDCL